MVCFRHSPYVPRSGDHRLPDLRPLRPETGSSEIRIDLGEDGESASIGPPSSCPPTGGRQTVSPLTEELSAVEKVERSSVALW